MCYENENVAQIPRCSQTMCTAQHKMTILILLCVSFIFLCTFEISEMYSILINIIFYYSFLVSFIAPLLI